MTDSMSPQRVLAPKREIFGWAMFDFANQAYTLLIITVIYGDLFTRVIVGDAPDYRLGNLLWSVALAISYLMVVIANPVCGAIMDYSRSRKRFLFASYLLTVSATVLLYFVEPGWVWPASITCPNGTRGSSFFELVTARFSGAAGVIFFKCALAPAM